jgi:hypothetical protein
LADILWMTWQVQHIERRHGVTARQFEEAWEDPDREELAEEDDPAWGPYFRSIGSTSGGQLIEMVWRWQDEDAGGQVWPITAYVMRLTRTARRRRRPKGKRRT